jgi:Mg2+/Co2+ transporter CorB
VTAGLIVLAPALAALLTLSALFSASETSLTAASRARMHQLERDGDRAAGRVNRLLSDQETMIGSILLGNNLVNIGASALATSVLTAAIPGAWGVAVATAVMTALILVFGEVLPKTVAITRPDSLARTLSGPVLLAVRVLGPVVFAVQWLVRKTLGLFGVKLDMETDVLAAHEEIRGAVEYHASEGAVENADRNMFRGVLDLAEMDLGQVMVHRKNLVTLDADLPSRQLIGEALNASHTRLPLYRDEPENIVGVLHVKDLARAIARSESLDDVDVMAVVREPWFVPETTNLKDQLNEFLRRKAHFALVVDEYGALQGVVTLEDILEEIVGEIEDEHDLTVQGVRLQPDGGVHVDGTVPIRDLNRAMNWELPEDDAVSVAGLVIHEAQAIPEPGQVFIFHGHRFQVLRRQRNQITALRISPPLDPARA